MNTNATKYLVLFSIFFLGSFSIYASELKTEVCDPEYEVILKLNIAKRVAFYGLTLEKNTLDKNLIIREDTLHDKRRLKRSEVLHDEAEKIELARARYTKLFNELKVKYRIEKESAENRLSDSKRLLRYKIKLAKELSNKLFLMEKTGVISERVEIILAPHISLDSVQKITSHIKRNGNLTGVLLETNILDSLKIYAVILKKGYPFSTKERIKEYILMLGNNDSNIDSEDFEELILGESFVDIEDVIDSIESDSVGGDYGQ